MNKQLGRVGQGTIKEAWITGQDEKTNTDQPLKEIIPIQRSLLQAINGFGQAKTVAAAIERHPLRNGKMSLLIERGVQKCGLHIDFFKLKAIDGCV